MYTKAGFRNKRPYYGSPRTSERLHHTGKRNRTTPLIPTQQKVCIIRGNGAGQHRLIPTQQKVCIIRGRGIGQHRLLHSQRRGCVCLRAHLRSRRKHLEEKKGTCLPGKPFLSGLFLLLVFPGDEVKPESIRGLSASGIVNLPAEKTSREATPPAGKKLPGGHSSLRQEKASRETLPGRP